VKSDTIYKYPISVSEQTIDTGWSPEALHVGLQDGEPFAWVKQDTRGYARLTLRTVMTGECFDATGWKHCGTIVGYKGLVLHVFVKETL
jgi:hypothetical protein